MIGTATADSETTVEELTLDPIFLLQLESLEPWSAHWQIMNGNSPLWFVGEKHVILFSSQKITRQRDFLANELERVPRHRTDFMHGSLRRCALGSERRGNSGKKNGCRKNQPITNLSHA